MPDFKAYLSNFSKTLGILKPFGESVEYNSTQTINDITAPFDGYMLISIRCTWYWVNVSIAGKEAPVLSLQNSINETELSATFPIKKGYSYHIENNWTIGRNKIVLFPLMNTN